MLLENQEGALEDQVNCYHLRLSDCHSGGANRRETWCVTTRVFFFIREAYLVLKRSGAYMESDPV